MWNCCLLLSEIIDDKTDYCVFMYVSLSDWVKYSKAKKDNDESVQLYLFGSLFVSTI